MAIHLDGGVGRSEKNSEASVKYITWMQKTPRIHLRMQGEKALKMTMKKTWKNRRKAKLKWSERKRDLYIYIYLNLERKEADMTEKKRFRKKWKKMTSIKGIVAFIKNTLEG